MTDTTKRDLKSRVERVISEAGEGYVEVGPRSRTTRTGARRTVFTGQGMEFYQARQFFWGTDDPRTLLSRAAARTGGETLFCRINKPETQTTVYLLGDISRTLDFGFSRESKLWLLARSAVTVLFSLKETQDLVLPALYANNDIAWRTPKAVSPMYLTHKLAGMILDPVYSTGRLDSGLVQALKVVPNQRRSEIVILSDFLNLTPEQAEALAAASRRHSVRALVIQDERERYLPETPWWWPLPAPLRVFDLHSGRQFTWWLTRRNRAKYTREFEAHEQRLFGFFKKHGIHYEVLGTNEGHDATRKVCKLLALPPLVR
jgi:uncharacterized protein (DUF58 family)